MDPIKEAFDKIKQDILLLKSELSSLKQSMQDINSNLAVLTRKQQESQTPAIPTHNPTQDHPLISTPTHNPTHQHILQTPIAQNNSFSTGNRGVPTDTSTHQQTNQQTDNPLQNSSFSGYSAPVARSANSPTDFEKASEILSSLDTIKKDIRLKFKRLTPQEMLVFSTIYSLEDQEIEEITYKIISQHLNLSESSIRDYANKLISKGIPVIKTRQNNKTITLSISKDLQKIANLSTINKLREL